MYALTLSVYFFNTPIFKETKFLAILMNSVLLNSIQILNIRGLHHQISKTYGLENLSLLKFLTWFKKKFLKEIFLIN